MNDGLPDDIWEKCHAGDQRAIQQVIVQYTPLVRGIASRMTNGNLPKHIDFDDLVSYGLVGLLDAIGKYDPTPQAGYERGTRFSVYAARRVRGSIMDELRSLDWVPRSVRDKRKDIDRAEVKLTDQLGREPTEVEVAESLGLGAEELTLLRYERELSYVDPEFLTQPDTHPFQEDEVGTEDMELAGIIAGVVAALPERDRRVLALYCIEGLTLGQIGEVLGVTQSRVCQLHTGAVVALLEGFEFRGGVIRRPLEALSTG